MSLVEIPLTTHKIFKSQIETGDYQDITTTEKKRKEQVLNLKVKYENRNYKVYVCTGNMSVLSQKSVIMYI